MIIAPNRFFLDYISSILPDLGVNDVKQYTFEDFAYDVIGKKLKSYDELQSDKYRIPRIEPRGNMNIFQFIVLILFGKYKI